MTRVILLALALILVGYGLFEARKIIEGPQISITTPQNGSATSTSALKISGIARNISFLTINDNPAYTDEAGHFSVTISPPEGYTAVTVAAKDRFGRSVRKSVFITILNYCRVPMDVDAA